MARLAALNLIEDVMGKGLPLQESIARSREYDALDAPNRRSGWVPAPLARHVQAAWEGFQQLECRFQVSLDPG